MLHRTTWIAIPVLAVVLAGSGLGWGYQQYRERQALALQTENQSSASFHGLVGHMNDLQEELGKARITSDGDAFQKRLRDIWRLSFAAQTEVGKLPFDLMPMHHTQQFLARLSSSTENWMSGNASPKAADVQKSVNSYYDQSKQLSAQLVDLQSNIFSNNLKWSAVSSVLHDGKGDNQIVDGFQHMDKDASAFVEAEDKPTSLVRGHTDAHAKDSIISANEAKQAVARMVDTSPKTDWKVDTTDKGAYRAEYLVHGNTSDGPFLATVSKQGGHVLSINVEPRDKGRHGVDFADAQTTAKDWLQQHGFGTVSLLRSSPFDSTAFYVFAPVQNGSTVLGRTISVNVDLSRDKVTAYDATNYFDYPVGQVAARRYSAAQLRTKLSPKFHVQMHDSVIVLDKSKHYVPAVAFYGTADKDTYCVYVNAITGKEVGMDKLS